MSILEGIAAVAILGMAWFDAWFTCHKVKRSDELNPLLKPMIDPSSWFGVYALILGYTAALIVFALLYHWRFFLGFLAGARTLLFNFQLLSMTRAEQGPS